MGFDPLTASGATVERSRVLLGAEIGHYWIFDQKIFDLSAYGKFVDNTSQNFSSITGQPRHREHLGAGHRRKPVRHGHRRLGLAQPDQHRAALLNYDAKFRAELTVASGNARLRDERF